MGLTKFQKGLLKNEEKFYEDRTKNEEKRIKLHAKNEEKRIEEENKRKYLEQNKAYAKKLDDETCLQLNALAEKINNSKSITSLVEKINELLNIRNEISSFDTSIYLDNGSGNNEKINLKKGEDCFRLDKSANLKDKLYRDIDNLMSTMPMPNGQEEMNAVLSFFKRQQTNQRHTISSCFKKYRNEVASYAREQYPEDFSLQELVNGFIGKPIDPNAGFFAKLMQKLLNSWKKNS